MAAVIPASALAVKEVLVVKMTATSWVTRLAVLLIVATVTLVVLGGFSFVDLTLHGFSVIDRFGMKMRMFQ